MTSLMTRRQAAQGKHILLVCCGVDLSKISIYHHIKSTLGVHLYCLEEPNNRLAIQLEEDSTWNHIKCDHFGNVEPSDHRYVTLMLERIHQATEEYDIPGFDGLMTVWDDAVGLMARLAEAMGLPGNKAEAIEIAHDKYLCRQRLAQCGLPCPRHVLIKETNNTDRYLKEVTANLEMPIMVKPGSGGSSIGVRKVHSREDIVKEYHVCLQVIKDALKDGELMGINMGDNAATDVLIEEFLEGNEVDVDVVLNDGDVVYNQVMDDWPYRKPWFCELGCHFPSQHPSSKRQEFINAAKQVVKAIGLTQSVHHLEFIDDKRKGPTLVEANPRMGGGPVYNFHRGAFGIDLMEEVVMSCLGLNHLPRESPYPEEGPDHAKASCVTIVCHARKSGILNYDVNLALELARSDPDVVLAAAMSKYGDHVTGWNEGFPTDMARIDVVSKHLGVKECIAKASHYMDDFFSRLTYEEELPPANAL